MLVIGLTGGIASGKSTVSRYLRNLGAPVVDADAIVHELQAPGSPLLAEIAAEFGAELIRPDGSLDRVRLGQIIFADSARRQRLEAIVHPRVRERMWAEVARYRQEGRPAVVLDIPLLFEGGLHKDMDQVWLVWVDRATELARLMARDGLTPAEAERRLAAQMDLDAKRAFAGLVFDNRGTSAQLAAQVESAWRQVTGAGE
ncbi:MAG TPA: dephospho-CoA kinase [Symbiobacteriaceae bacterium]|jgi:dephospho-CoA kinase